jgi:tetratricopeptide (TPR) repeat protein
MVPNIETQVDTIRFNHDPEERRKALLELEKLGMVEELDAVPTQLKELGKPGIVEKLDTDPIHQKESSTIAVATTDDGLSSKKSGFSIWPVIVTIIVLFTFLSLISNQVRMKNNARIAAASEQVREGEELARQGDIEGALAKFEDAQHLDPSTGNNARIAAASEQVREGEELALHGDIEGALEKYENAQRLDPGTKISARYWNNLCWYGSLWGYAAEVMDACEEAVSMQPESGAYRDSRGLARALTGDYVGAIEDFRFFVEWGQQYIDSQTDYEQAVHNRREIWIVELEANRNPFTEEELEYLRRSP